MDENLKFWIRENCLDKNGNISNRKIEFNKNNINFLKILEFKNKFEIENLKEIICWILFDIREKYKCPICRKKHKI